MPANMPADRNTVTPKVAYTLYLNHSLSTWNARMYEFAAVIFTAAAYPKDLTATSIFGITMDLSVVLFASLLGTWVDRGSSRLTTLIYTISANRISIIAACICWFFIVGLQDLGSHSASAETMRSPTEESKTESTRLFVSLKSTLFVLVLFLGIIERLSRTANLFSIERDWVPVMAAAESPLKSGELPQSFGLTQLNAVMSRIDLICKLISPIVISTFISVVGSVEIGILAVLCLNGLTLTAEIWSARSVWNSCDRLHAIKEQSYEMDSSHETYENSERPVGRFGKLVPDIHGSWWQQSGQRAYGAVQTTKHGIVAWFQDYVANLQIYFDHDVWIPSMALSMLHFSVLNYSATLSTYLNQSAGFSWNLLTIAKALSAMAELGSTFFTPWGVRQTEKRLAWSENLISGTGTAQLRNEDNEELLSDRELDVQEVAADFVPQVDMGVAVLGFWSLVQMLISLIPSCIALWILSFMTSSSAPEDSFTSPVLITLVLLTAIPISRFGRWINHLTTQQLTQTQVPANRRSAFAGAEISFISLFGLGHWVATAIWSSHGHFRWLALGSVCAVGCSVGIYALWLRRVSKERYGVRGGR